MSVRVRGIGTTGTADAGTMRSVNRTLVLDAVKTSGPISRAAIAKLLSLAKPTVSVIIDELLATGLVRELARDAAGRARGRPAVLVEFNARSMFVAGIHVGVQSTRIVVADAAGAEIARRLLPTSREPAEAALLGIATELDGLVASAGLAAGDITSVGISVPGLVDLETGTCVQAPNLGWRNVPVAGILSTRIHASFFVHNGAQAAAAAESMEGAGRGSKTLVMLYAGTGVGAAVLHEGRLFHGSRGMAGEIGHVPMPGASETCACGLVGCLETLASAQAVARAARAAVKAGRPTAMADLGEALIAADVYAAAEAGDPVAREILVDAGRTLGLAGAWLVNVVNPDVLVLGGGLAGAGPTLVDAFCASVRQHALGGALERLTIRTWALGQDAKVRGAVILALQKADQSYRLVFGAA